MSILPLEKEVEAAFFDYVQQDYFQWESVKRQVKVPLGIIDILGFAKHGGAAVVEIKRGTIDRKTVGQLMGYIGQVNLIIEMVIDKQLGGTGFSHIGTQHETCGYLIGKSIDKEAENACKALGFTVYLYEYNDGAFVFNEYFDFDQYLFAHMTESDCSKAALEVAGKVVNTIEMYATDEIVMRHTAYTFDDTSYPRGTVSNNKFITIKNNHGSAMR